MLILEIALGVVLGLMIFSDLANWIKMAGIAAVICVLGLAALLWPVTVASLLVYGLILLLIGYIALENWRIYRPLSRLRYSRPRMKG